MKKVKSFVIALACGVVLAASAAAIGQNQQPDPNKKDSCCAMKDCCKDKDCCKGDSCSKDGSCCCGDSCQIKHDKKDKNKTQ
jgi:hypothetical protein